MCALRRRARGAGGREDQEKREGLPHGARKFARAPASRKPARTMFRYEFEGRSSSSSPVSVVTSWQPWRRASSIRAARIALWAPRPRYAGSVAPNPSQPTPSCTNSAPCAGRRVAVVGDVARPARAGRRCWLRTASSSPASRTRRRRRVAKSSARSPGRRGTTRGRCAPRAARRRARTSSSRSRA